MGEFLMGWKRKIGCVTLVMALVLVGAWVRSRVVCDVVSFTLFGRPQEVCSFRNKVFWWSWNISDRSSSPWSVNREFVREEANLIVMEINVGIKRSWFHQDAGFRERVLPYWHAVLPLAFLSAYLILRSGKRPDKHRQSDQTPAEGT